jgi:hypothetical protein
MPGGWRGWEHGIHDEEREREREREVRRGHYHYSWRWQHRSLLTLFGWNGVETIFLPRFPFFFSSPSSSDRIGYDRIGQDR